MRTGTCGVDDVGGRAVDDAGVEVDGIVDGDVAVNDGLSRWAGFSRSRETVCQ